MCTHKLWPISQICETLVLSCFQHSFHLYSWPPVLCKTLSETLSHSTWIRLALVNKRTHNLVMLTFHLSVILPYKLCKKKVFEKVQENYDKHIPPVSPITCPVCVHPILPHLKKNKKTFNWKYIVANPEGAVCHCKGDVRPQVRGKLQHLSPLTSPLILTKCTKRISSILIHLMCISSLYLPFNPMTAIWRKGENKSRPKSRYLAPGLLFCNDTAQIPCAQLSHVIIATRAAQHILLALRYEDICYFWACSSFVLSDVLCVVLGSMQLHLSGSSAGIQEGGSCLFSTRIQFLEIQKIIKDLINCIVPWFAEHVLHLMDLLFFFMFLIWSSYIVVKTLNWKQTCIAAMQHSCGLYFRLFDICMCVCSLFNAEFHIF